MDMDAKKKALRMIQYGLFVMTARHQDKVGGGTVNWVSQASFEPPLIMAGVKKGSGLLEILQESGAFAVNVLAEGQKEIAGKFFKGAQMENGKINGLAYEDGKTGAPLLLDTPAFFECRVTDRIDRGDHTVIVGEVINAGVRKEEPAMVMRDTGWFYGG
ncbi:MAG: flavin reductase [Nitrospirae bacterium]|nr:flavin reductase [Nitrospirota bacterium]